MLAMKKQFFFSALLAATFPFFASPSHGWAETPPVVVELFTSQGCSSCPPADKILAELAKEKDVIALSVAVDYWDYIGWKDTHALPGHAPRQRAYAKALEDMVYTPQMVINGAVSLVGNSQEAVRGAMALAKEKAPLGSYFSVIEKSGDLEITFDADVPKGIVLYAIPINLTEEVAIGRGENAGRTITYVNIPREWIDVSKGAHALAKGATLSVSTAQLQGAEGVVLLMQKDATGLGPILDAALLKF